MSVDSATPDAERGVSVADIDLPFRLLALASAVVLIGSYVSILYHVTDVVGDASLLLVLLAATVATSTLLARYLGVWSALVLGVVLLVGGLGVYLSLIPSVYLAVVTFHQLTTDTVAMLSGLSVLRMTKVNLWALGVAPGPVFLSWYLALRRRYVGSVVVSGVMLGFFVLTGDAGPTVTLVGVLGAVGAVGFGTLAERGGTWEQVDVLAIVLVAMIVASTTVSVVPGTAANPLMPSGGEGSPTVEGNLLGTDEQVNVVGSIQLSPKVRFSVTADEPQYWRTSAYDRYTGGSWVRTGSSHDYQGTLGPPPGDSEILRQQFTAETRMGSMPAAWRPARVGQDIRDRTRVTDLGDLRLKGSLRKGASYVVESRVPQYEASKLRNAPTDYPNLIRERYLQLPESTPDRVGELTANVTAGAENPYDAAAAIEEWLEAEKSYSLDVERPEGDIADSFLFEMEQGYCVYYATTMVTMLRTQDIPARFVVGYTPGQRVDDDEWVVRGLDAHAWVEVYFPTVGWVTFDPTPGGPREAQEQSTLDQARAANVSNVDTGDSESGEWTPTPQEDASGTEGSNGSGTSETAESANNQLVERLGVGTPTGGLTATPPGRSGALNSAGTTETDEEGSGLPLPPREQLLLWMLGLVGVVATAHRTGTLDRAYRSVWVRWQWGSRPPERDVDRAFSRLEYLLGREYRRRRPGETAREYLAALDNLGVDERAHRVRAIHERAEYGGAVSHEEAREAVDLVDAIVDERLGARRWVRERLRRKM